MPSLAGEPLTAPDDPAIHGELIKTWHLLACLLYFYMSTGTVLLMDMFFNAAGHVYWYCWACLLPLVVMSTGTVRHVYYCCWACLLLLVVMSTASVVHVYYACWTSKKDKTSSMLSTARHILILPVVH